VLDGVQGPLAMLGGGAALDAVCAPCWTPAFSDGRPSAPSDGACATPARIEEERSRHYTPGGQDSERRPVARIRGTRDPCHQESGTKSGIRNSSRACGLTGGLISRGTRWWRCEISFKRISNDFAHSGAPICSSTGLFRGDASLMPAALACPFSRLPARTGSSRASRATATHGLRLREGG